MKINAHTGLLDKVPFYLSPNHDERPPECPLTLIVIHIISLPAGEFGGPYVEQFFCNQLDTTAHSSLLELANIKVSAHAFIRRTGKVIQFVPFHKRAWHAGASEYQGKTACNDFSIGIELEGSDTISYEPIQYQTLATLITALITAYPNLNTSRITGHEHISPGRKTDPGPAFDWPYLHTLLNHA